MNKENVLFSIIGLLLGCIIGFMWANSVNQRGAAPRPQSATSLGSQNPKLPPDHPALPSNTVADQEAVQTEVTQTIQKARDEPNNFEAQMKAAHMFYQIRRYDEAVEFLLRANQLRPDSYEAVVNLGNVNFDAGRYEVADRWYTAALIKNPDDVNVRTDLGLTFLFRNPPDVDRAIKEFRRSLERDPRHEQTLQNLVVALTRKSDAREAQATLEKLEEVNPANPALPKLRSDLESLRSSKQSAPAASQRGRK